MKNLFALIFALGLMSFLGDEGTQSFTYTNEKEKVSIVFPTEPTVEPLISKHTQAHVVHNGVLYELHMMHVDKKKKTSQLKAEWMGYLPGRSKAAWVQYKVTKVEDFEVNGYEGVHIVMEMPDKDFPVKHSWEFGVKSKIYYRVNLHAKTVEEIDAVKDAFLNSLKILD